MTPERWQQIEEIFHAALELDGKARLKFIKVRARDDADLKAEVERLLAQFEQASSFIEQPLYDSGKSALLSSLLDDSDDDPMVGIVLGSYRIEREIGRGGMGAVYEAYRADGEFRLRVALKVVKRGVDTDFVLRRFRNERQILAALDHPFITRLIDGGTTADGRPYFVMDFIDGLPLYRFSDKNSLSVSERLKLFCRICEAVEYAHHKLVIHRDLKPSNIFITGDASPRLLDFGIAKLLDPQMASDTLQPTATALRMMTVDYASPEQVRGEKVTFSTDVYSLGVILFELLTGHRPYSLKSRSPHDVARAICDDEPWLPSNAVSSDENTPPPVVPVNASATTLLNIADLGRESPPRLRDQLRGNLDGIIIKALRKDPGERYESVAAFRQDIERHLSGEAVAVPHYFTSRGKQADPGAGDGSKLVAVLPLSLMGPSGAENTDEAYLTVGLADAIITRLASVRKLTVRPTSSITRYNEHQINPFRAGLELGVDYVLDGRIRRFGERLRISLQLLDVKAGSAIWAGQFDEHLTDVLELEDAIAEQVAAALIPQLTGEEKQKLAKRGTDNPRAHEAYLKGRFYWNQFTAQSLPKAIDAFEQAVELDPQYALAHVGVADFYLWGNIYGLVPADVSLEHANAAIRRAMEIDNELADAYASLGLLLLNQFEYEKAEELFLKAIGLNPNHALPHEWHSALLVGNGRFEEALVEILRAEEIDPLSLRTKVMVLWTYYQVGEFHTALEKAEEIISLDENYPQGHLQRGYVLCELGRAAEGVASIEHCMKLMPGSALAMQQYAFALAAAGRPGDAVRVAEELKATARNEYVKPMFIGLACIAAGQIDEGFAYLDVAVDERDPWLAWFGTDPKFQSIRTDERYLDVMQRVGRTGTRNKIGPRRDTDPNLHASLGSADAQTIAASEMPTLEYRPGPLRRHAVKLVTAGLAFIIVFAAYQTGVLTVYINDKPRDARIAATGGSIAVLPLENRIGDASNDYLADGISENLINQIANSPDIRTISRSAAFTYKNKQMDPRVIGRELGTDYVLAGLIRRQADEYTIHAELINVADGTAIFSRDFTERSDRVFALPMEIATRIIETINVRNPVRTTSQHSYTENNEAFQLYLKGEFHRQKATPADLQTSIGLYEKALESDPGYALAYQGLTLAYRSAPAYGTLTPQEAYPKAKEAAQTALAIDPSLSTPYVALASIKATYDWDYEGAETAYKNAIKLGPNNSEAHYSYGNFLVAMGRSEEALTEYRFSQQLDPLSPNVPTNIGWALYVAGRYDEAAGQIRQVIARDPSFARAYLNLGEILQEQGKHDEAIASIQKARDLSKDSLADMALGHAYATAGRRADALRIATELEEKVRQKQVSPFLPAVVYAGLNEKDKAFYWLERAYQERSNWLTLIKIGRRLRPLHNDPRFDDLLKRVGFGG